MSFPPVSSEDRRELDEAAAERGVTVDELVAERIADIARRERESRRARGLAPRWEPAPSGSGSGPVIPHDPATIELGRRNIAAIRKQFLDRRRSAAAAGADEEATP